MSELKDIIIIGEAKKEKEAEHQEEAEAIEEVSSVVKSQVSLSNLTYISLLLLVYAVFGFLEYWASIISTWITTGFFLLDSNTILTYIINFGLFLTIVAFLVYYPRLSREIVQEVAIAIGAIILSFGVFMLIKYFGVSPSFNPFNLILISPLLIYITIISYRNKRTIYHQFLFITAFLISLALFHYQHYVEFTFFFDNPLQFIAILSFQILFIIANYLIVKESNKKGKSVVKKIDLKNFI